MRHRSTACVAVLISLASFAPSTSVAAESKQSVVIYVLGLSIDGTVAAGPLEASIDVDSSEIFDALDFGGMGSYRHETGPWSVQVDAIYAELSAKRDGDRGATRAFADLEQAMIELDMGYRVNEAVELILGARYWDYDADVRIVGTGPQGITVENDASKDWVDPLVGARVTIPIGQRWSFVARGDVGGFGIGSDFSWHATAFLNWQVNNSVGLLVGYRRSTSSSMKTTGRSTCTSTCYKAGRVLVWLSSSNFKFVAPVVVSI